SSAASAMELADLTGADVATRGRAEALAARIAIEQGHADEAAELAATALMHAREAGRADIECDALEVSGRATTDFADRIRWFERSRDVAAAVGLTARELHAEFSASTIAAVRG